MILNIHAGHNPDGKIACGAVGLIRESTEARNVKNYVVAILRRLGHTVYDCTEENGKNQADVLQKIVKKTNAHKVDLDISIHFNSGANDKKGNGKTTGVEVLLYNGKSKAKPYAEKVLTNISVLGFKNRGIKYRTSLYYLRKCTNPCMLIECCFVDDKDDVKLYDAEKMAIAICNAITKSKTSTTTTVVTPTQNASFVYENVDYSAVFDANYYADRYADLRAAFGNDAKKLFNHFVNYGMNEHRQAIDTFNVDVYKNRYADLRNAFGNNINEYYKHYCVYGAKEGRNAI